MKAANVSAILTRLKLPLEIASIVVALLLGALALWQQLRPTNDLVADVVSAEARLPSDLIERAKALPDTIHAAFLKDKDIAKVIPEEKVRKSVAEDVKDIIERHTFLLHSDEILNTGLMSAKVSNTGEKPLKAIKLTFRFPVGQTVTVIEASGEVKSYKATGVVDLGDLPPRGYIKVFAWGHGNQFTGPDDVTISHQDGIGQLRLSHPVPEFMWRNGGIFFSYRHTTYVLLAVVLLFLGTVGIVRHKAKRNRGTRRSGTA